MRNRIPWLLIYLRMFLTVFAVGFAFYGWLGWRYIVLMAVAAASDVYDGRLARRWDVETASLRQWDSIADTIFFLGVLAGIWVAYPAVYAEYKTGIFCVIGLEAVRYVYDLAKFRRGASYHAASAKAFGVTLLTATIAIMGFGNPSPFLEIALLMGMVSGCEGLLMSFILKEWTYNVKHVGVAITIRNETKKAE